MTGRELLRDLKILERKGDLDRQVVVIGDKRLLVAVEAGKRKYVNREAEDVIYLHMA